MSSSLNRRAPRIIVEVAALKRRNATHDAAALIAIWGVSRITSHAHRHMPTWARFDYGRDDGRRIFADAVISIKTCVRIWTDRTYANYLYNIPDFSTSAYRTSEICNVWIFVSQKRHRPRTSTPVYRGATKLYPIYGPRIQT